MAAGLLGIEVTMVNAVECDPEGSLIISIRPMDVLR